jgi:hypothetical protein
MPAGTTRSVTLQFDPGRLTVGEDAVDLREGLSATVVRDNQLWVACDEGCRLERLTQIGTDTFGSHTTFELGNLLALPAAPTEEADVEGLDISDGFIWLVGSHSVKRKKAKLGDAPADIAKKLGTLSRDGNRHLLARIPIVGDELRKTDGTRTAARLDATASSSALLDAVASPSAPAGADKHLAAFVPLPGKDNGFDIEGLAVADSRVFIGLRGPVLREWCCVLECQIGFAGTTMTLVPAADGALYRKHFLKLNGFGVRDLTILGDDLLILAGPAMAHDGPGEIWRWKNGVQGAQPDKNSLTRVVQLPMREGCDRPEGLSVYETGAAPTVMVVFDTPAKQRHVGASGITADVFALA